MSYQLRAVIGNEELLRGFHGERPVVPLPQGHALIPIEEQDTRDRVGLFCGLTEELRKRLVVASESGPVAFVEAELFGGRGTQSAIVWRGGAVVLGPLHTQTHDGEEDGYITSSDLAINQVLRVLGVSIAGAHDEFDALGLGRFRETGEWAALSSGRLDT